MYIKIFMQSALQESKREMMYMCMLSHSLPFDKMHKQIEWHFETLTSKGEMK
jgi:hypothetical protein